MKNMIIITLLSLTILSTQLSGMEKTEAIIIDQNEGQSLKNIIGDTKAAVGVFGATPRYAAYENFMKTLDIHLKEICDQHEKGHTRLKHIDRAIKRRFYAFKTKEKIGAQVVRERIGKLSDEQKTNLFLSCGMDENEMKKNIGTLLQVSKSKNDGDKTYLAHVLLPSYFTDAASLKNNPKAEAELLGFLRLSASFYQNLYNSTQKDSSVKTCIIIPQLKYFIDAPNKGDQKKSEMNLEVITQELIKPLAQSSRFIFIDQNEKELRSNIAQMKQTQASINGVILPIKNGRGQQSTIFHQYYLKPEKTYSYQRSPIINEQLKHFLEEYGTNSSPKDAQPIAIKNVIPAFVADSKEEQQ